MPQPTKSKNTWRQKLFTIVFEADTKAGRIFDISLLLLIVLSIVIVMLESIPGYKQRYGDILYRAEWLFTILFTIEYILRLLAVKNPVKYATSFYGVIDLLSILPTYFSLIFPQSGFLMVIRSLRLMRIFRIFKLSRFIRESMGIVLALKASARRILVFLSFVVLLSIILGTITYVAENPSNKGFTSIPQSVYWAVVTITTVGYGDVSPVTAVGKLLASLIMLLGYAIIAVPTGIVTVELSKSANKDPHHTQACPNCSHGSHDPDAIYCKLCGHALNPAE
jgi:voltage-gated potassium channel